MTDMIPLSLTVLGTNLELRCPENQMHALRDAADLLDREMRGIKHAKMDVNPTRIAILAALKILVSQEGTPAIIVPQETEDRVDHIMSQLEEALL